MARSLTGMRDIFPAAFEDFFRPWNDWSEGHGLTRTLRVSAMNITEEEGQYKVSLTSPGLKKEGFNIDGNTLTISAGRKRRKAVKSIPGKSTTIPPSPGASPYPKMCSLSGYTGKIIPMFI